jgi:ribosomal protein S10
MSPSMGKKSPHASNGRSCAEMTEAERRAEERWVNEAYRKANLPEARRRRANTLPTLEEIEYAKLLWPQQKLLLSLHTRCRMILTEKPNYLTVKVPDHWMIKVTARLDRLVFPELTQGRRSSEQERLAGITAQELVCQMAQSEKEIVQSFGRTSGVTFAPVKMPSRHKRFARLLAALKAKHTAEHYTAICHSGLFAIKFTKVIMDAVWKLDDLFLIEFGKALEKASRADCKKARVYRFLLRNAEAVERCRTVSEIMRLPDLPEYDVPTFYKLCRQVGLPVAS